MLQDDKTPKRGQDKKTSPPSNSQLSWLKPCEPISYLAFLLFLLVGFLVWPVKDVLHHQSDLTTLGATLMLIALTIRCGAMTCQIRDKGGKTSLTEKRNQIRLTDVNITNESVKVGVLILLIFCVMAYLAIERDYQLICLESETLNSIGLLIWGIVWLAESIEEIIIKNPGQLFSPMVYGLGLIFSILYLPLLLLSPALCR